MLEGMTVEDFNELERLIQENPELVASMVQDAYAKKATQLNPKDENLIKLFHKINHDYCERENISFPLYWSGDSRQTLSKLELSALRFLQKEFKEHYGYSPKRKEWVRLFELYIPVMLDKYRDINKNRELKGAAPIPISASVLLKKPQIVMDYVHDHLKDDFPGYGHHMVGRCLLNMAIPGKARPQRREEDDSEVQSLNALGLMANGNSKPIIEKHYGEPEETKALRQRIHADKVNNLNLD